ncbi:MAG: M20 family metallopeptidase [Puniceicoccaceae bacterium]
MKSEQTPLQFDLEQYRKELEFLVNIDSGSRCVDGVNQVTDWFSARYAALGWPVEQVEPEPGVYGRSAFTWYGDRDSLDLLIICHTDTVFPEGTAKERPFSIADNRYHGPGVADMKAGCLMAVHAIEQLQQDGRLKGHIGVLLNGEHELSCPTIRPFIEKLSSRSKVVVTTEPGRPDGSCVRQRKGILRFVVRFHGRSAHSGVNPEKGRCAVTEMSRFIVSLRDLQDPERGITVNPGLVTGGTSVNAIPDFAECRVDIRVVHAEDATKVDEAVRILASKPHDADVAIDLEGGITRPPLVPNERSEELIERINEIGRKYGIEMTWGFSGGGSDASYASAMGKPALCGLGPVGGGYHTEKEYLETVDLQERICIFRDIVESIGNGSI